MLITIAWLMIIPGLNVYADTFNISARVCDETTGFDIKDGNYRLLEMPDSAIIAEGKTMTSWLSGSTGNFKETILPDFTIRNIEGGKKYILEITADRYEPLYVDIDISKLGKREGTLNLGHLDLKKAHRLEEVTVTATKLKFYNKGDTVIYNADAFKLAEGSMLDALIAQLPGAELTENGQIFVEGRLIESLLLNSKDFFKGNNKVMLENLGAYTVKNIAVYDRQREEDKVMGKNYGKTSLTMDVRLKKEYQMGLILNAEAGYGIKDKFLGRLFGLWYNYRARVGFYGNANNTSNLSQPKEKGTSAMPSAKSREITTYAGGIDYEVSIPRSPLSFSGNANATYSSTKSDVRTYTTNFLPGGDTYGYSFKNSLIKSLKLSTEHSAKAYADTWNWEINPKFNYVRNNAESRQISATFNREWDDVDRDFIEKIYSGETNQVLTSIINRSIKDEESHGNKALLDIQTEGKNKVNSTDAITYHAAYTYQKKHNKEDELLKINYDDNPAPALNDRRRYYTTPDFNWHVEGGLGYILALSRSLFAEISYTYQHRYSHTASELYREEDYIMGQVGGNLSHYAPSAINRQGILDVDNSFDSRYREEKNDINLNFTYNVKCLRLYAELPLSIRRQSLHYLRGDVDATLKRTKYFAGDCDLSANIYLGESKPIWIYAGYTRTVTSPDMVDMVDFTNTLDPLNIRQGNPNLKDADSENMRVYYNQVLNKSRNMRHDYGINATIYRNSLAYGYTYNRTTGVKSGKMYNVMGNARYSIFQNFSTDFASGNCMNIKNNTTLSYNRSADMLSSDAALPTKNIVNDYGISETVSLGYNRSWFSARGEAKVNWKRFTSHQTGFIPFNAWNMSYSLIGNINLSSKISINTDFNIYARRGYPEASLNTNNYVWNARLTYKLMKGNMLLMLDGFDILHNLSNVHYSVNAQARTETYSGVVPSYCMLHVQWKFNKAPKIK